jgi:AmiR/NasT family two-component response regulator
MGEHQCQICGHIVTGFEKDDFEAGLSVLAAKDAEIERLRNTVADMQKRLDRWEPKLSVSSALAMSAQQFTDRT